jgi:hypothetical protein
MKFPTILIAAAMLSACGAETAATAVTVGKLKAEDAKRGQQQMEQVKQQIDQNLQQAEEQKKAIDEATK